MEILEGVFPSCSTILKSLFFMIFRISSISQMEGSSTVTSFNGASVWAGSIIFSFPRVSVVDLVVGIRTGVVIVFGGEISGEKTFLVLVTLLVRTTFLKLRLVTSVSSSLTIHGSFLTPC